MSQEPLVICRFHLDGEASQGLASKLRSMFDETPRRRKSVVAQGRTVGGDPDSLTNCLNRGEKEVVVKLLAITGEESGSAAFSVKLWKTKVRVCTYMALASAEVYVRNVD